jgi:acyl-CoA reductase-like NAD-dependent aldehyde dehydrogenase
MAVQRIVSPIDGSIVAERTTATAEEIGRVLAKADAAQREWRSSSMADRQALCERVVQYMLDHADEIGLELTHQMGRPIRYTPNELRRGFQERARHMSSIAPNALADLAVASPVGTTRFIRRDPVGIVLVVAPWNYPYLTSVNTIVPAILAGNAVVLKHATQTLLCAERYREAFVAAGAPSGLFQIVHATHDDIARVIDDSRVGFVAFTGSVEGGHAIQAAASRRFIGTGLELGGKDPSYVRSDADLPYAIGENVDGSFFNSGQSCCGIERIYVHTDVYDEFIAGFVDMTRGYVVGDPRNEATTIGPLVTAKAAEFVRGQIAEAMANGARRLIGEDDFDGSRPGTAYLGPTVLVDVDHTMRVMTEESFGPVIGIMRVRSDDEALQLMNDSAYGLTAAIWTADVDAALSIGDRIETGTVFMNRCDYLDPALAWTGVKNTGHGATLSVLGFGALTRPKSFHFRTNTA